MRVTNPEHDIWLKDKERASTSGWGGYGNESTWVYYNPEPTLYVELNEAEFGYSPELRETWLDTHPEYPVNEDIIELFNSCMVYMYHYDEDNKITTDPSEVRKTFITLYDQKEQYRTWERYDPIPKVEFTEEQRYKLVVTKDREVIETPYIQEKDVGHLISTIKEDTNVGDKILSLLSEFFTVKNTYNKSITVKVQESNFFSNYNFKSNFLGGISKEYYNNISLELNDKTLNLNTSTYNIDILHINHTDLTVDKTVILDVEEITIENTNLRPFTVEKDVYPTLSIDSVKKTIIKNLNVKDLVYITVNMPNENLNRWMESVLDINNIDLTTKVEIHSKLYAFVSILSVYKVNIFDLHTNLGDTTMNILNIKKCDTVNINNTKLHAYYFRRAPILLRDVRDSTICSINVTQEKKWVENSTDSVYIFNTSNLNELAEVKIVTCTVENIGILKSNNDRMKSLSFSHVNGTNYNDPFKYNATYIGAFKIIDSKFKKYGTITLEGSEVSFFNCDFHEIDNIELNVRKKVYISEPKMVFKNYVKVNLREEALFLVDKGYIYCKNFAVNGDNTGKVHLKGTETKATESISIEHVDSLSITDGRLHSKDILLSGKKITDSNPSIMGDRLTNLTINGENRKTYLYFIGESVRRNNIKLEEASGSLLLNYKQAANVNFTFLNSSVAVALTQEPTIEGKVDLLIEGEGNRGGSLQIASNAIKLTLNSEGDLSYTDIINEVNTIKAASSKDKFLYSK